MRILLPTQPNSNGQSGVSPDDNELHVVFNRALKLITKQSTKGKVM